MALGVSGGLAPKLAADEDVRQRLVGYEVGDRALNGPEAAIGAPEVESKVAPQKTVTVFVCAWKPEARGGYKGLSWRVLVANAYASQHEIALSIGRHHTTRGLHERRSRSAGRSRR